MLYCVRYWRCDRRSRVKGCRTREGTQPKLREIQEREQGGFLKELPAEDETEQEHELASLEWQAEVMQGPRQREDRSKAQKCNQCVCVSNIVQ